MNPKEIKELIKDTSSYVEDLKTPELVKILKHLSDAYYNDEQLVDDNVFDELVEILKERDPENKFFNTVGAPVSHSKKKVKLPFYIGSLDKKKPKSKELEKWFNDYEGDYVVSEKLDGDSAVLQKKDDVLHMYSRGDGNIGHDISHLIDLIFDSKFIKKLPKDDFVVRGELIVTIKDFKSLQNKITTGTSKTIKNARNMVAGLVNSKTIDERRKQIADVTNFIAYRVYDPVMTPSDQMKWLEKYGFDIVYYDIFDELSDDDLKKILLDRKSKSQFDIDGLVVAHDAVYKLIPDKYPKDTFAYKLPNKPIETTVLLVEWNESQYGYLKPRILVKTIKLPDVDINYVTAHNAKYIVDNKIGIDAIIQVIRSGDVIPKIVNVVKPAKVISMPSVPYKWNDTKVDLIAISDEKSQIKKIKEITSFFKILNVEFLGQGVITKLVDAGFESEKEIIMGDPEEMSEIEGLGMKSIAKIKKSIYNSIKNLTIGQYMSASHVFGRGFGEKKLNLILDKYPNIIDLDYSEKKLINMISGIVGFEAKTAKQFATKLPLFIQYAKKMNDVIDVKKLKHKKQEMKDNKFDDMSIVFTGFRDKELEALIKSSGGKISTSVSSKTSLVVAKDIDDDSAKIKNAKKLGIKLMTLDDFKNKYNI